MRISMPKIGGGGGLHANMSDSREARVDAVELHGGLLVEARMLAVMEIVVVKKCVGVVTRSPPGALTPSVMGTDEVECCKSSMGW